MKLLVTIPLCDYEPLTTAVWSRRATHYIVKHCLTSFRDSAVGSFDLHVLADRCTDRFVHMAEHVLGPLQPVVEDNSCVRRDLARTNLPEKVQHILNQLLRAFELAEHHDIVYFCEQDYLFKHDALGHALAAFREIPAVTVLSPFDHPDRHDPQREVEHGRHRYFPTSRSIWKSVSSTNGNFLWRMSFVRENHDWLTAELQAGALDFRLTNALYEQGRLLLSPVRSLIQHYRLDGSNASPTFGPCPRLALTRPVGHALRGWQRFAARLYRPPSAPTT